jgi:hypothetical protein
MAMAGRADSDTRIAVEKNVAINIFNPNALSAFGDKLKRRSGI